jgi:hypothetical protein
MISDDISVKLGIAENRSDVPSEYIPYLLARDREIAERYFKALARPSSRNAKKCSKCDKSTRKERVCDICFAWERLFNAWYRNDPVGKRLYNLINDSSYKEQITESTFADCVEIGEEARLYGSYVGLSDWGLTTYDVAHLFPKRPSSGTKLGMHTRNNLLIVPSFINRKMGNYIFSEDVGETVDIAGKRRVLRNKWGVVSKKFKFIEQFKKINWFKDRRSLEKGNSLYSPDLLLERQAERFGLSLDKSWAMEDKWLRLLMHCLDSSEIEMESLSGFHKALVGFGFEYPDRVHFYLKGLNEDDYKQWCIVRGYNPNDEFVLKAVEWFIHWQADDEMSIFEGYNQYKDREPYDPSGFPFLLVAYSSSIRLVIKVLRDYPNHDMNLQYTPNKKMWAFPESLKLSDEEVVEEASFLAKYFNRVNASSRGTPRPVDMGMIAMQIAFLGDYGVPTRIYHTIEGEHCTYPFEEI